MKKVLSKTGITDKDIWWFDYLNSKPPKVGYAGVLTVGKKFLTPLKVTKGIPGLIEEEGRVITTEFSEFYLVNVYFPFSGVARERL